MTGEEFVKLCFEEKEEVLKEYFATDSQLKVSGKIQSLIKRGISKDELYELINLVLA